MSTELSQAVDVVTEREEPEFEVRPYQLDAWGKLWDARRDGATSALVHLATGLGKTSVGVFDAMKFREEFREENGREPKILFTCHKNEILEQAEKRFKVFMPDASRGFYAGESKDKTCDITFATLQSLYAGLDTFESDEFDYIIDDEVHHAMAPTFEKVIRFFEPSFRLGLTATPNRADEKDIRDIYGQEVYSKGLTEALTEGWLARPDYHLVFDDAIKQAMQSGFEMTSLRELSELFNLQPRNEVIAQNIKGEMERIGLEFGAVKTIVFCQSIEHAEQMAELLQGAAYHSDADSNERRRIFEDFKHRDLQVITTRDMFNEGVDVPDARLLVFMRSTSSQTIFEQQLGRGLRKHAGKDSVSILDFAANIERIAMLKELAEKVSGRSDKVEPQSESTNEKSTDAQEKTGMTIHFSNGDFEFDRLAVNLLERYNHLKVEGQYNPLNKLSNEELIALAKTISPDSPLTSAQIHKLSVEKRLVSYSLIVERFGSLSSFQKECGFEVDGYTRLSNEELVALARSLSPEKPLSGAIINQLSKNGRFVSYDTIISRFGNLRTFKIACGFEINVSPNMTPDELVELALELSPDKPLSSGDIKALSSKRLFVSPPTIAKHFGNIQAFHEACGFEIKIAFTECSNDELIAIARRLSPEKPMTKVMVEGLSKSKEFVSVPTLVSRFGSMKAFKAACGWET